jgi:hypothetical protein
LPSRRTGGGPDLRSQELTTTTASISIMKSGPARGVTPTVVLVGVAGQLPGGVDDLAAAANFPTLMTSEKIADAMLAAA